MTDERMAAISSVEAACDAFESRRQQGQITPFDLSPYLKNVSPAHALGLTIELIKLDIYYSWKESPHQVPGQQLETYLVHLNEPTDESLLELIRTEFTCRQEAGSPATSDEYVSRFESQADSIRRLVAELVCEMDPICTQIVVEGLLRFQTFLSGTTMFGRQRKGDPPPYANLPNGDGPHKFVVAAGRDPRISREHAIVLPLGKRWIEVRAVSQKSDTVCNDEHVQPGQPLRVELPCDLYVGPQLVRLV